MWESELYSTGSAMPSGWRMTKRAQPMFDWGSVPSLEATPGVASGAWVFKGTRVPVRALLCNLRHSTIEEFCEQFPTVRQEDAEMVLEYISGSLIEDIVEAPRE